MAHKDTVSPPAENSMSRVAAYLHSVGPEYPDMDSATIEKRKEVFKQACNNASRKVSNVTGRLFGLEEPARILTKLVTRRGREQHAGLTLTRGDMAVAVLMQITPPKLRKAALLAYMAGRPLVVIVREGPQVLGELKEAKAALDELSLATLGRLGFFRITKEEELKLLQVHLA